MLRRTALVPLIALVALTPLSAQDIRGRDVDRFTWSERVGAGQWLRVYSPNGRIDVSEASGDVAEVVGDKDVGDGRTEDVAFEIMRNGDGVTICALLDEGTECREDGVRNRGRWSSRGRTPRANFTVRLPRGVKLAVGSGNGDVSVRGATAEVSAASGNGRVRVHTTGGPVRAATGNGEVTVEGATGPVRASSGNGDVRIGTTRGPVSASTGNGDVMATMDAIADVADDMEFSTGNGTVTVTVPADFVGELHATTGSGRIYTDFPLTVRGRIDPRHLRATIGSGGRRLTMTTGNGDVELRKK